MPNLTPNYSFNLPLVNDPTDQDLWGGELNTNFSSLDTILNTRTQDYNFAGFQIIQPLIKYAGETIYNLGTTLNGAVTIDLSNGNYQYGTLSGNITSVTITNPYASGKGNFLTVELNQPGGNHYTIALSGSYHTVGGLGVTLTAANSAKDKLRFESRDGGSNWDVFTNLNIS